MNTCRDKKDLIFPYHATVEIFVTISTMVFISTWITFSSILIEVLKNIRIPIRYGTLLSLLLIQSVIKNNSNCLKNFNY